jgi:hypothetical protein
MTYASTSTIVAFQDTKEAALYSDHVVPIMISDLISSRVSDELQTFEILPTLLPTSLVDPKAPRSVHPGVIRYVSQFLVTFPQAMGIHELSSGESVADRNRSELPALHREITALLGSVSETVTAVHGIDQTASAGTKTEDVSCQLIGLKLVDVSRTSWRQLVEFREDKACAQSLRNLRIFMQEKFDGKPQQYVRDSLLLAIERHDEAVKRWGFETKTAALESIFSSKSIAALAAGTITIALGAPVALGAAAVAAFELGNVSLKIVSKRRGLAEFRRFDPVTYLVSARELAEA